MKMQHTINFFALLIQPLELTHA